MDAASSNNAAAVSKNVTNAITFGDIDLCISNEMCSMLLEDQGQANIDVKTNLPYKKTS